MHEDCAIYASKVCPFLAIKEAKYTPIKEDKVADGVVMLPEIAGGAKVGDKRPEKMGIYICRQYDIITQKGQHLIRVKGNWKRITWF